MKTEEYLLIGGVLAGGYLLYNLSQPIKEVGGSIADTTGAISGALNAPLGVVENSFGVLSDSLADLRKNLSGNYVTASTAQALQEQAYKEGFYKGGEEKSDYYTQKELLERQNQYNKEVSTLTGQKLSAFSDSVRQNKGELLTSAKLDLAAGKINASQYNQIIVNAPAQSFLTALKVQSGANVTTWAPTTNTPTKTISSPKVSSSSNNTQKNNVSKIIGTTPKAQTMPVSKPNINLSNKGKVSTTLKNPFSF